MLMSSLSTPKSLSENRPEWTIADFASLLIGAVTVPVYATLTPEQTAFILRDSGVRAIFVSSAKQLVKVNSIRDQTGVERVALMDSDPPTKAVSMQELMDKGPRERASSEGNTNSLTRMLAI